MGDTEFPVAVDPERWNVVFHRKSATWLMGLVVRGHFKHVSAFAYLNGLKGWVLYDVQFGRTRIIVLPDTKESRGTLAQLIHGNDVVVMTRKPASVSVGFWPRLFCTGAIKHLLGISGIALRPDTLWRQCLANGGVVIPDEISNAAAGSAHGAAAGAS